MNNNLVTNRDYIDSLNNEELANYIYDVISVVGKDAKDNRTGVAEWLGKPREATYFRAENCQRTGDFAFCLKCPEQNCGRLFSNGMMV